MKVDDLRDPRPDDQEREPPRSIQRLTDTEQTRNRLEILNQFFRGMLLLNGGGIVALLAFLQAIWKDASPGFVQGILQGMMFFVAGLAFTVVGQYLRYEISKATQFKKWYAKRLQTANLWLVVSSVLAFIAGAGWVVGAVWDFAGHAYPRPLLNLPQS